MENFNEFVKKLTRYKSITFTAIDSVSPWAMTAAGALIIGLYGWRGYIAEVGNVNSFLGGTSERFPLPVLGAALIVFGLFTSASTIRPYFRQQMSGVKLDTAFDRRINAIRPVGRWLAGLLGSAACLLLAYVGWHAAEPEYTQSEADMYSGFFVVVGCLVATVFVIKPLISFIKTRRNKRST